MAVSIQITRFSSFTMGPAAINAFEARRSRQCRPNRQRRVPRKTLLIDPRFAVRGKPAERVVIAAGNSHAVRPNGALFFSLPDVDAGRQRYSRYRAGTHSTSSSSATLPPQAASDWRFGAAGLQTRGGNDHLRAAAASPANVSRRLSAVRPRSSRSRSADTVRSGRGTCRGSPPNESALLVGILSPG